MFKKAYKDWSGRTNERQKLQGIFAAVALVALVAAGLLSLLDNSLGMLVLNIAYVAIVVWIVNFVTWAVYLALTTPGNDETVTTSTRSTTRRQK